MVGIPASPMFTPGSYSSGGTVSVRVAWGNASVGASGITAGNLSITLPTVATLAGSGWWTSGTEGSTVFCVTSDEPSVVGM